MSLEELVLFPQRLLDRFVRRMRLGPAPASGGRRFLIVQIDGLSRSVLESALAEGRMPFLSRLIARRGFALTPMSVGLPTSTPAFQLALMYGVRPDIPGFHYYDKRRRKDIYFPRAGDAALVEEAEARGRRGILSDGSSYGCVFAGGASNNLFSFARIMRPTGAGLMRACSAVLVLAWVFVKSVIVTAIELGRALLRLLADPVGESARGWKWLTFKIGISVWLRQLFTLAASRDLYAGVPAIYVNYLDYDVFAHAFGPRHRRAMRELRGIDRSIRQLWRVVRRVPEHRYDLYVLSDHGQASCVPFPKLSGGESMANRLFAEIREPSEPQRNHPTGSRNRGLTSGIKAYRSQRAPGLFQRFVNYLERDFPWVIGESPRSLERGGVRVVTAGPNVFLYFLDSPEPLQIEEIDSRSPGLAEEISSTRGVGFVLARSKDGPVCLWRGKRYFLDRGEAGPFAEREDRGLVLQGVRDLMAMPSSGDLVLYGNDSPDGNVSYLDEVGAHAGPSPDELHTFIIAPPGVVPRAPINHPVELYPHFIAYQER